MEAVENLTEEIGMLQKYIDLYAPKVIEFGIRILLALLVFLIGTKLIKFLRKLIRRSLERANVELGPIQFLDSILKVGLYVVLILFLASGFGVDAASVIALVGSAGVAIGLAMQGYLENIAGGVLILIIKPFKVGDYIIQGDLEGTVSEIQMVYTYLLTPDNRKVVIPNGKLANNSLINVTAQDKRRLDIEVGISYGAELKKAKEVCQKLIGQEARVLQEEEHLVAVTELGEDSVVLKLRFWVRPEDYWQAKWDMTEAVKLALDEAGIEIPFRQMDIHIKEDLLK